LAAYQQELLSTPSTLEGCPRVEDMVPKDARYYLESPSERMLRSFREYEAVCRVSPPLRPYADPKLKFNKKMCRGFAQHLSEIGFRHFAVTPKEEAGVFFVWKSNRSQIRMIIDARRGNRHFLEPPGVALRTAEGLSRIEIELPEGARPRSDLAYQLLKDTLVFLGLVDVRDCFHRLRAPLQLAEYCALPPLAAKAVGLAGVTVRGRVLGPKAQFGHALGRCAWGSLGACAARRESMRRWRECHRSGVSPSLPTKAPP
jgi:hypothetical protein